MTSKRPIAIGLMCKPPRPDISKTRLARAIGANAATTLSSAFLRDCATAVRQASTRSDLRLTAFYRPDGAADELRALLGTAWNLEFADQGDLGATMAAILQRLLHICPDGALLMGADVPLIDPLVIEDAANRLRTGSERDVVIAPTFDGGYCLIGVKSIGAATPLFEAMQWSTPDVLDETLQRARRNGLQVSLTSPQRDIDHATDLIWLRDELKRAPDRAMHTREAMHALDGREHAAATATAVSPTDRRAHPGKID